MANLLLTEVCVRSCPYCFAKQYMDGANDYNSITKENFIYAIDFLERSGIKQISLLGGEPLIHHQAAELIEYLAVERGFDVCIFTSGILPPNKFETFVDKIKSISQNNSGDLTFVVNVNEPRFSPPKELDKVHQFLSSLSQLCSLSFNIYRLDYNIDFLIEYILKFGIKHYIRFGLANPIPGSGNQYISPQDFNQVKITLMPYLAKMYDLHIYPTLDCGFPMCMFTEDELGKLYKYTRNNFSFECGPTIDIGTDLMCWSCFPLSNFTKKSLKDFRDYVELYTYFEKMQAEFRKEIRGLYVQCDTCRNFEDEICCGGCLAHVLNTFHKEGNFRMTNYG